MYHQIELSSSNKNFQKIPVITLTSENVKKKKNKKKKEKKKRKKKKK